MNGDQTTLILYIYIMDIPMKMTYLLMGALTISILGGCQGRDHEEGRSYEPESNDGEDNHEGQAGLIMLTAEKARAADIATETVKRDTFRQVILTGGQILAAQGEETTVAAGTSGIVKFAQTLTTGTPVERGAVLFHLSSDKIQGGNPAARAYVAYQNAKAEYERVKPLAEKQIVTRKELERLKAAYEDARICYEALLPHHSEGAVVAAPTSGYVKSVTVKEGDYVTTGQPLMTLTRNRRLGLRADVPERYYGMLDQISSARFKTPYDDEVYDLESLHGRILSYGKASDENASYIPVVFEFDNTGDIVPGCFVEAYLTGAARAGVISLPVAALTEEQGTYFVYLQESKETYRKQEVKTGAEDGLRVEILSGLKPGDRVVTQGAYHVKIASTSNAIPAHNH